MAQLIELSLSIEQNRIIQGVPCTVNHVQQARKRSTSAFFDSSRFERGMCKVSTNRCVGANFSTLCISYELLVSS